jgi:hypothetical protein
MSNGKGLGSSLREALPATAAIAGLVGLVIATLAIVGASDIPSLTRGAPVPTVFGAGLLLGGVILTGIAALFAAARRWLLTAAYAVTLVGLVLYVVAAIHVTSDPPAPRIAMTSDLTKETTTVAVDVNGLAFNERLQIGASFADDPDERFERVVIGAGNDGKAHYEFVVEPQSRRRRLRVTAQVLRAEGVPRDIECNSAEADRTCAEAARVIGKGIPEVRARLRGRRLGLVVQDRARIPGLVAIRVVQGGRELYATRTRVDRNRLRRSVPVPRRQSGVICVAAAYGEGLPRCDSSALGGTIVRLHAGRRAARTAAR